MLFCVDGFHWLLPFHAHTCLPYQPMKRTRAQNKRLFLEIACGYGLFLKCQNYLESLSKFSRYLLNSVQRWCLFRTVSRNIPYFFYIVCISCSAKNLIFFLKKNSFNTRSDVASQRDEQEERIETVITTSKVAD